MDRDYDALFRIMILGDTGVGKTCLLQRFCDNEFRYSHVCTIGIDFKMKTMVMDGIRIRIQIWDTAGQERYRSITRQYFKKAQGIILAYDVTDEISFSNVRKWLSDIKEFGEEDVSVILVGNKSDREDSREITNLSGKELAEELDIPFYEVSAYTSENVSEMFGAITGLVLKRFEGEIRASLSEQTFIHTTDSEEEEIKENKVLDLKSRELVSSNGEKSDEISCCHIL